HRGTHLRRGSGRRLPPRHRPPAAHPLAWRRAGRDRGARGRPRLGPIRPAPREADRPRLDALDETLVLGVRTNLRFLRWLLDEPVMRDGEVRIDTLATLPAQPAPRPSDLAWSA